MTRVGDRRKGPLSNEVALVGKPPFSMLNFRGDLLNEIRPDSGVYILPPTLYKGMSIVYSEYDHVAGRGKQGYSYG